MDTKNLIHKTQQYVAPTYHRFEVSVHSGVDAYCFDLEGNRYIDFTSGIGVNSLGFCNDKWAEAVCKQAKKLNHISNLYYTQPGADLALKLCKTANFDKVFFANSGAEANECAIKLARKKSFSKYGKGRSNIITLTGSFHGRTITTLSATGQSAFHADFFPFTEGFIYVPVNDIEALKREIDNHVCAVICELIQGEGGVVALEPDYVKKVQRLCRQKDVSFIIDEVQTGIGRTGCLLAAQHYDIQPDLVTLAKGLGGGLPIGACLMSASCSHVLQEGDHAATFGMNPIVCAGANVVMDAMTKDFLQSVKIKGKRIKTTLQQLPQVKEISGLGLMVGVTLKTKKASSIVRQCNARGLLTLTAKDKLRLLPPLNISNSVLQDGLSILSDVLQQ